jgi:hypothetical protein
MSELVGILKANDEKRYALAPLYLPGTQDAHAEYIEADELQAAVWDYVRKGDLRLRLQHDRRQVVGEVVEIMALPWAIEAPLMVGKTTKRLKMPAGTVLMGAVFTPEGWRLLKAGKLGGWSLGGRARRVPGDKKLPTPDEQRGSFATVKSRAEPTLTERVTAILEGRA